MLVLVMLALIIHRFFLCIVLFDVLKIACITSCSIIKMEKI